MCPELFRMREGRFHHRGTDSDERRFRQDRDFSYIDEIGFRFGEKTADHPISIMSQEENFCCSFLVQITDRHPVQ